MIDVLPQTDAIDTLKDQHQTVLAKLHQGPVLLMEQNQLAAVLVSPAQWNQIITEWKRLKRIVIDDQRSAEMDADPAMRVPFTKAELIKRGLIDA